MDAAHFANPTVYAYSIYVYLHWCYIFLLLFHYTVLSRGLTKEWCMQPAFYRHMQSAYDRMRAAWIAVNIIVDIKVSARDRIREIFKLRRARPVFEQFWSYDFCLSVCLSVCLSSQLWQSMLYRTMYTSCSKQDCADHPRMHVSGAAISRFCFDALETLTQ